MEEYVDQAKALYGEFQLYYLGLATKFSKYELKSNKSNKRKTFSMGKEEYKNGKYTLLV
jgi:hypothetical protein